LVKPNDLITDGLVQTCIEPYSLPIKLEGFQHVKFELVNNYLTPGSIKGTNVLVCHYHNVFVKDNDVAGNNDQNDMFKKALIDVNLFGVFNLKGYVHSQSWRHFYLKYYREPSCFSLSLTFSS
jgi:hypothetical protein